MYEPFDYHRYQLKPLDRDIAEKLGHAVWLDNFNETISAVKAMIEGLKTAPCNVAVWPNAQKFSPYEQQLLTRFNEEVDPFEWNTPGSLVSKDALRALAIDFYKSAAQATMEARRPDLEVAAGTLRRHMIGRLHALSTLFPKNKIYVEMSSGMPTSSMNEAHIDFSDDEKVPELYRFVEVPVGPMTFINANDDVEYGMTSTPYGDTQEAWHLKDRANITFWQLPQSGLALFSNENHHCQPVLHGAPPTAKDSAHPQKRMAMKFCIY